jgi:hypothetical protein
MHQKLICNKEIVSVKTILLGGTKNLPRGGPLRETRELLDHSPHRLAPIVEPMLNDKFLTTSDEVLTAIAQRSVFTVRTISITDPGSKSYLRDG